MPMDIIFGALSPSSVQHVKTVLQVGIELLGGVKPLRGGKRMSLASSV